MEERGQSFDICIVCALYEEARAVFDEFSKHCAVSFTEAFSRFDRYAYRKTTIQNKYGEPLKVLVTWLADSGPVRASLDLRPILQEFHPRFAAMTGLCAGYKGKVKLGDLVVAEYAYHYEEGKILMGADGRSHHLPEMRTAGPTAQVIQYAKGFDSWREPVTELKRQLLGRPLKPGERPNCLIGVMASGMAVRGDNPFPWLAEFRNRKTIALDMEAAAFYLALRAFPTIHSLVVKGVCDYADMRKNDRYHDYAARASAVYLLSFLREYVTDRTMPRSGTPSSAGRGTSTELWYVPHARNPYFTGREELLGQLHQKLTSGGKQEPTTTRIAALAQPLSIKGLGGIGKTQIALEYAYRYRDHYPCTLWINSATEETLIASFVTLADLLPSFAERDETDQQKLVEAVKRWLEQREERWLLIFDNADDLPLVRHFLPQRGNGSILLTTRATAVASIGVPVEVETMGFVEGTQFLLRRAQREDQASDEEVNEAGNIVVALDYFPLALDQAGAYIEETQCRLSDYLQLYQTHRKELLARRGLQATSYPDSVATTWSLSFQKVERANPAAAELLRVCAFLAPDVIPEELFKKGALHWEPPLQHIAVDPLAFDQSIAELLKFSLVKRSAATAALSIHRLVQAVLLDSIPQEEQRHLVERVILAVNDMFPADASDLATWPQCLRLLDQVQACDTLIKQYTVLLFEAADLLNRAGIYLEAHALHAVAEPLYRHALAIDEQMAGSRASATASTLNNLARLLHDQGKYEEAESLYLRALAIDEQELGPQDHSTATILNNLAGVYRDQRKYEEAEPFYLRALAIDEQLLGSGHPSVAICLSNLAGLYRDQGRDAEAEPLYQRAVRILEQQYGAEHPSMATILNNLAGLYCDQGKYEEAESLYRRAVAIDEQQLGPQHLDLAVSLSNLADLYEAQGKLAEAGSLYKSALLIRELRIGSEHPETASSLNDLAGVYLDQGKYEEAERYYQRALAIDEQQLGSEHPRTGRDANNLAVLYERWGRDGEAEPLYRRALAIDEKVYGAEDPEVAIGLNNLARLRVRHGQYEEAERLYQRALHVLDHSPEGQGAEAAEVLHDFAAFLELQGNNDEARILYERALSGREQALGPRHAKTSETRERLSALLRSMGGEEEAALLEATQTDQARPADDRAGTPGE